MPTILAVQSFRRGTGKSNLLTNLAVLLAARGKRVGLVDADFLSPSTQILLGIDETTLGPTLNEYLAGTHTIQQVAHPLTAKLGIAGSGELFLIPANPDAKAIAQILRDGYDTGRLNQGFHTLIAELPLDILMIDTHAGINEETMLAIAISDVLAILVRPDQQDYQGTLLTIEMARNLDIPRIVLVVNQVPPLFDTNEILAQTDARYNCEIAAILPHTDELLELASTGVFVLHHPDHPLTTQLDQLASILIHE